MSSVKMAQKIMLSLVFSSYYKFISYINIIFTYKPQNGYNIYKIKYANFFLVYYIIDSVSILIYILEDWQNNLLDIFF